MSEIINTSALHNNGAAELQIGIHEDAFTIKREEGTNKIIFSDESGTQMNPNSITKVTVTLPAADWDTSALTQVVTVAGILEDETAQLITPVPATASLTAYKNAGIFCSAQTVDSLTFTAEIIPAEDLTVYVVIQAL